MTSLIGSTGDRFSIRVGDGLTASELLEAGGYDQINGWAKAFVNSSACRPSTSLSSVQLVLISFDADPTYEEVLHVFEHRGLDRPQAKDALRFGMCFPSEQLKHPLVFLHDPWHLREGAKDQILVLNRRDQRRRIYGFPVTGPWTTTCRFPARLRVAS